MFLNIIWFILGGFELALCWAAAGLVLCCTVVGIPFGIQCFKVARLVAFPMGTDVTYHMGVFKGFFNILWACTFGLVLGLCSFVIGLLWCCTIIGLPIGFQWFKVAKLSFMPFGTVVD